MRIEKNLMISFLIFFALIGVFSKNEYVLHILVMIIMYSILATSLNLIVGYVGEFPLGHVAFFGLGAYGVAILSSPDVGIPVTLTIPLAALLAAIFGWFIGRVTLRLNGPFFVIVTLSFAEVLRLLANNWIGLTNGPMGIAGVGHPMILDYFDFLNGKRGFVFFGIVLAAISFYLAYKVVYSSSGRAAVTIRENSYVAQSIGINPLRYSLFVFMVSAFMAGMAGAYYASYISYVGPEVFGFPFTVTMIIMLLVGGKGTLIGPILGAIIITLLEEYLRDFKELRLSIFGLIVIAAVIFSPNGLMGYLKNKFKFFSAKVDNA